MTGPGRADNVRRARSLCDKFDLKRGMVFALPTRMHDTKHILSTLSWRGLRLSPKVFLQMCKLLPSQATAAEIREQLSGEYRLKLAFEKDWYDRARRELDWLHQWGARLVTLVDSDYPDGLKQFRDAPTALTVKGASAWMERSGISVVGSRHPSQISLRWMDHEFDQFLQKWDVYVVSGGARGIDQKAHSLALRTQRPTVCFVPAGLGALYPAQLEEWVRPIVEGGGCLVSTYAPSCSMNKNLFIERNRYIAAISHATFIVEAKRKSGTLVTARWAQALDRPVGVLPCSPCVAGLGGLDVLADNGIVIRDHSDLIVMIERARARSLPLFAGSEYLL